MYRVTLTVIIDLYRSAIASLSVQAENDESETAARRQPAFPAGSASIPIV